MDRLPDEPTGGRMLELLPELFFTLLSIIQGAAFVYLCERVLELAPQLGVVGWIEAATTLLLIVFVWHRVVTAILAFYWWPTFADAALPFALGAAELVLAHAVGTDPAPWLGAMTLVWTVILLDNVDMDTRTFRDAAGRASRPSPSLIRRSFLIPTLGVGVPAALFGVEVLGPADGLGWIAPAIVLGVQAGFIALGIVARGRF